MATDPPADAGKPPLVERLREQRHRHRDRSRLIRGLYVLGGFAVLAAGIVMLATPGPAFVLIPIGLAILSLEFLWAEKLLDRAIEEGEKAKQRAAETTTAQRVASALLGAAVVAGLVVWAILGDIWLVPFV